MIYRLDEGDGKLYTEDLFLKEFRYTFQSDAELKEIFMRMPEVEAKDGELEELQSRLRYIYQSELPPVGSIISTGPNERQWVVRSLEGRTIHVTSCDRQELSTIWEGPYMMLSTVIKN